MFRLAGKFSVEVGAIVARELPAQDTWPHFRRRFSAVQRTNNTAVPRGRAQGFVATLVDMSLDPTMALRDVKNHLSEVVDQVEREHHRVVITRHGKPAAVVISADDLASLEETLEVMSRPTLIGQIRDSREEMASGEAQVLSKDDLLASLRP